MGTEFWKFFKPFRFCFNTRTHSGGFYALGYLRGQLTMEDERNFANIERRLYPGSDGQNTQQFMSDSPWSGQAVFERIQQDIREQPALGQGGLLILDESADAKSGPASVGASRQYNGRLGKIDVCQVATGLALVPPASGLWTLVDGEVFLPEKWFTPEFAQLREKLGVPPERTFQTKPQLGLGMIRRAVERGLPFERVVADNFYGRNRAFRAGLGALRYALQVPENTPIALSARAKQLVPVLHLALRHKRRWRRVQVRSVERGLLEADFVVERIWTPDEQGHWENLWLVMRRDIDGKRSFTLLNDPADTPAEVLIRASCERVFVECVFEEAKSELGWDDFRAQKYLAWEHHLAITAAALWFIAGIKLKWRADYHRDPRLKRVFQLEVLPALSTANVRELL